MKKTVELKLFPDQIDDQSFIWKEAASIAKIPLADVSLVEVSRRSIDARGSRPVFRLRCDVWVNEMPEKLPSQMADFSDVSGAKEVYIIGAGPAGYSSRQRQRRTSAKERPKSHSTKWSG
jgi:hypothetical protein